MRAAPFHRACGAASFARWVFLLVAPFLFAGAGASEPGRGSVWAALVLGTTQPEPPDLPPELAGYGKDLAQIFGYNRFDLLGHARGKAGGDEWLIPSRELFLRVKTVTAGERGYRVRIELFRGQKTLVQSEAKMLAGEPLYIRGPAWGAGHLVVVLAVVPGAE